jgi:hypothetical protein
MNNGTPLYKVAPMRSDSTSTVDSLNGDGSASGTCSFENNAMKRQLYKTKICRHNLIGRCKYNDNCYFAHSVDQIARRIDFRRTKLCSKSNCKDPNCLYAHSVDEIRDPYADICPNWINGSCVAGNACKLSHNLTHLEEMAVASGIKNSSSGGAVNTSRRKSSASISPMKLNSGTSAVGVANSSASTGANRPGNSNVVPQSGILTPTTACDTPSPNGEPTAEELVQALIRMLSSPTQFMDYKDPPTASSSRSVF